MKSSEDSITPLQPVHEYIWKNEELCIIKKMIENMHNLSDSHKLRVDMVTKRAKAVMRNGFVLPGASPNHCNSCLCFVKSLTSDTVALATILYYSECLYDISHKKNELPPKKFSKWIMAVEWHMEHPCKVWYGYPAHVWSCMKKSSQYFLPVSKFVSRTVYVKATVNFGSIIGCIPVIIATPIECDCL